MTGAGQAFVRLPEGFFHINYELPRTDYGFTEYLPNAYDPCAHPSRQTAG